MFRCKDVNQSYVNQSHEVEYSVLGRIAID